MAYPTFLNHSPQPDFIGVILDAPIFFRVEDSNGLNISTLNVQIEGVYAIQNGVYQSGYSGVITNEDPTPKAISVIINHSINWAYNQEINIASEITNNVSITGNDVYHFLTIPDPDKTAPFAVANPHGNLYNSAQAVTLTGSEPGVVIHYTLNGTDPTLSSPLYSVPILISSEGKTVLKFIGIDAANNYDKVRIEEYVIDTIAPTTVANPAGGNYINSRAVELIANDPTATIFYTTNGAVPTTSSTIYSGPITIQDNHITVVKFFAVDKAGNVEVVKTETYTIEIAKNNYLIPNVFVKHAYIRNELQITWEDMYPMHNDIIGYNIYRSDVEHGEYLKLNKNLITIIQYIDKTLDAEIINEDVSEQFRRTVNIAKKINDSFGGMQYDCTKWTEFDFPEFLFQNNGLIFTDKIGLTKESKLTSKFKLKGNFNIQVEFELLNWIMPLTVIESCIFRVKKDDNNFIQVARSRSQTQNVYSSNRFVNGNPDLPVTVSTSKEYGKFRIIRNGNLIGTYYYDETIDNFVLIQSLTAYTEDLYVEFVGQSGDVPVEMRWFNFVMNSGNPIIIEPRNQLIEYVIQTSRTPIVDSSGTNKETDETSEVQVTINGQQAYIKDMDGYKGLVRLETDKSYDEVKRQWFVPQKPDEYSTVLVTYKTPAHTTKIDLRKNYFYKVTCVTNRDETDLDIIKPEYIKPEKLTYIFEEAIRRNAWLNDQSGERVLLFIKKRAGTQCPCIKRDVKERTHKKPDKDCPICYGAGFVGGFYDPFNIIISNLTTEQRITQTERGLHLVYQIETWTGPFPLITQRDMIVRRNGDRCLTGPITPVEGPGGVITQQHFTLEVLDARDIRYTFPIQPLHEQYQQPGIDKLGTSVPEIDSPKERENLETSYDKVAHENKNVDHIKRGRSLTFENIEY